MRSAQRFLIGIAALPVLGAAEPPADLRARYESAEQFLFWNLEAQVPGLSVEPQWEPAAGTFWYRRGHSLYSVDPARRREIPLDSEPPQGPVAPASLDLAVSPDGRWGVRVVDGNLVAISMADGRSRQLTTDGAEDHAYASPPDSDLEHLKRRRLGQQESPQGLWSPDGRRYLTYQVDQRGIASRPMVLSTQPGSEHQLPHTYVPRLPLPGADRVPLAKPVIFDTETGARIDLDVPPLMMLFEALPSIRWSADGRRVRVVHRSRDSRTHTLYEADAATGTARRVLAETSRLPNRQVVHGDDAPIFTLVGDGPDVIVRSVRDGWAHFYLYDGRSGALRNRITHGEWSVHRIEWVDAARRKLYFTAGGREPNRDPYLPHLYRIGLDGSGLELLTPEDASHEVRFEPSGRYFIDTGSTVSRAPVTRVRTMSGKLLMTLMPAELSYLSERDWVPPRREKLLAADGVTEIWATIFFPPGFDSGARYPLIEVIYGGPQAAVAPTRFLEDQHPAIPLTRLGFITVVIDGRGSALRSQAFQDFSYGRGFGDEAIVADHIAAIRQLAGRYPAIDLDRIGIYGHSWGGYWSARAMLQFPDFYEAGVSSAGSHDNFVSLFDSDRWLGLPQDDPLSYSLQSNIPLAPRLRGKLLLMHGEADEIVHPANSLQLADALIRANRPFDMLLFPNRGHADLKYAGYFNRRVWDYFVRNLLGLEPPAEVSVRDRM